jgi:hypothetical protein
MTLAPRHTETTVVAGQRLGLRPRDTSRDTLKLANYLTGVVPQFPSSVDYFARVQSWILGRNDEFSTCGPTALANYKLLVSTWLGDSPITVSDDDIFDLYRRSGNPDFDPSTGAGDNGVEMTVMLSAAVQGGLGHDANNRPLAFAEVNSADQSEVFAAGALFGGMLWGADLSTAQQAQTDQHLWDYAPHASDWGGHAVLAAGRYRDLPGTHNDRTGLVTWATPIDATDRFISTQVPQRFVVIWPEHLGSKSFLQGVNLGALAADYREMTGRPFPTAPTTPANPDPSAADVALADATRNWANATHIGSNGRAAEAVRTWITAKGL